MKRKKKVKKYTTNWYMNLFSDFVDDSETRSKYDDLYNNIYSYYKPKIENKEINISKEKIALEAKAGKYKGFATNFNLQLMIIPFTLALTALVQFIGTTVQARYSPIVSLLFASLSFVYIVREISKEHTNEKELIYNICLKVIEDIEKEILNKGNLAENLVAATIEKEDQKQYMGEGNYNINISLPDVIAIASGAVKTAGFVRKILKMKM